MEQLEGIQDSVEGQEVQDVGTENGSNGATDSAPSVVDLDSLDKFKYQGREWTQDELKRSIMMNQDYTKKTQALAQERQETKYWENLRTDLDAVRKNPALMGEFMKIYPSKFHTWLDDIQSTTQTHQGQGQQAGQPQTGIANIDPGFYREFLQIKADLQEKTVQAIESDLDRKFASFEKKYPHADEQVVLAHADRLLQSGDKLTNESWDKIWKEANDRAEGRYKSFYSKQVTAQKTANKKGADVPGGGGTPGQAPRVPRTIKEATRMALDEYENSR